MKKFSIFVDHLDQSFGENDVFVYINVDDIMSVFGQFDFFHQFLKSLVNWNDGYYWDPYAVVEVWDFYRDISFLQGMMNFVQTCQSFFETTAFMILYKNIMLIVKKLPFLANSHYD